MIFKLCNALDGNSRMKWIVKAGLETGKRVWKRKKIREVLLVDEKTSEIQRNRSFQQPTHIVYIFFTQFVRLQSFPNLVDDFGILMRRKLS